MSSDQDRISGATGTALRTSASEDARGSRYLVITVVIGLMLWTALGFVLGALAFQVGMSVLTGSLLPDSDAHASVGQVSAADV